MCPCMGATNVSFFYNRQLWMILNSVICGDCSIIENLTDCTISVRISILHNFFGGGRDPPLHGNAN